MSAFRGRRSGRSDEEEHSLDEFSEELSTYTNPDVDSFVFEAGGKSITIKQVLTRICYFALFDDHFADSRRHQSLWRHRLGCRLLFGLLADLPPLLLIRLTFSSAVVMVRYVEKQYGRRLKV